MIKVKVADLVEFFRSNIKGAAPATIKSVTIPAMNKTDNPYFGKVHKVGTVNVMLNINYEAAVNRQRAREDSEPDFEAAPRVWGERITGTPLVQHKGQYYLEAKCQRVVEKAVYLDDAGNEVSVELLEPFLRKGSTERQELENPIIIRDFKVESIKEIRVAGFDLLVE